MIKADSTTQCLYLLQSTYATLTYLTAVYIPNLSETVPTWLHFSPQLSTTSLFTLVFGNTGAQFAMLS